MTVPWDRDRQVREDATRAMSQVEHPGSARPEPLESPCVSRNERCQSSRVTVSQQLLLLAVDSDIRQGIKRERFSPLL